MLYRRIAGRIGALAAAAGLSLFLVSPQVASAQSQPPTMGDLAEDAMRQLGINCIAYSSMTLECGGYNANNIYISLVLHLGDGSQPPSTLYVFDPYSGRSVHITMTADEYGNVYFYATDSQLGTISFNDGWLSVFYPTGNPFSAAVHDPGQFVVNVFVDSGELPTNDGPCPLRLCPIQA